MTVAEQNQLCKTERDNVRGFLMSGDLGFNNLLRERIACLDGL